MIRIIPKARLVAFLILVTGLCTQQSTVKASLADTTQISAERLQEKEVQCLAKNIYYESRGEPKEGMVAVGIVTLNRVEHPKYPDTICEVVKQRTRSREGKTVCQFSWTCKRLPHPAPHDPNWKESVQIAKTLLLGKYTEWQKKYDQAHHFHSARVSPGWRNRVVARVGRHIFYR